MPCRTLRPAFTGSETMQRQALKRLGAFGKSVLEITWFGCSSAGVHGRGPKPKLNPTPSRVVTEMLVVRAPENSSGKPAERKCPSVNIYSIGAKVPVNSASWHFLQIAELAKPPCFATSPYDWVPKKRKAKALFSTGPSQTCENLRS